MSFQLNAPTGTKAHTQLIKITCISLGLVFSQGIADGREIEEWLVKTHSCSERILEAEESKSDKANTVQGTATPEVYIHHGETIALAKGRSVKAEECAYIKDDSAKSALRLSNLEDRLSRVEMHVRADKQDRDPTAESSDFGKLLVPGSSPTTILKGDVDWILGATRGSEAAVSRPQIWDGMRRKIRSEEAATSNYRSTIETWTTFSGTDNLRLQLRSGNFGSSAFSGYRSYVPLAELEIAIEGQTDNRVKVSRLYYQTAFANGRGAIIIGPIISTLDLVAVQPTIYGAGRPLLAVFRQQGLPGAYNYELGETTWDTGSGAGLWLRSKSNLRGESLSISANYTSPIASHGMSGHGGIGATHSRAKFLGQLAYGSSQWHISAAYSYSQQNGLTGLGTQKGGGWILPNSNGQTFGINGFWQPLQNSWAPSISLGAGIMTIDTRRLENGSTRKVASWMLGFEWQDVVISKTQLGIGIAKAPYATDLKGSSELANDSNMVYEAWYKVRITDNVSLVPGIFYLHRPLGRTTGDNGFGAKGNSNYNVIGGIMKAVVRF